MSSLRKSDHKLYKDNAWRYHCGPPSRVCGASTSRGTGRQTQQHGCFKIRLFPDNIVAFIVYSYFSIHIVVILKG